MISIETFATERLLAERLSDRHFDDLSRMHHDPLVMKTLAPADHPNGGMLSDAETRQFLARDAAHWERHGFGLWAFHATSDRHFVGRCGLRRVHIGGSDEIELAYALIADDWGRGFATEMAEAVVRIGFDQLALPTIVCFTLTTNLASQRVMQKAGFRYERDLIHAGLPHVLYRRTKNLTEEQRTNEQRTNGEPRTQNQEPNGRAREQTNKRTGEQRTNEQGNKRTREQTNKRIIP